MWIPYFSIESRQQEPILENSDGWKIDEDDEEVRKQKESVGQSIDIFDMPAITPTLDEKALNNFLLQTDFMDKRNDDQSESWSQKKSGS